MILENDLPAFPFTVWMAGDQQPIHAEALRIAVARNPDSRYTSVLCRRENGSEFIVSTSILYLKRDHVLQVILAGMRQTLRNCVRTIVDAENLAAETRGRITALIETADDPKAVAG